MYACSAAGGAGAPRRSSCDSVHDYIAWWPVSRRGSVNYLRDEGRFDDEHRENDETADLRQSLHFGPDTWQK